GAPRAPPPRAARTGIASVSMPESLSIPRRDTRWPVTMSSPSTLDSESRLPQVARSLHLPSRGTRERSLLSVAPRELPLDATQDDPLDEVRLSCQEDRDRGQDGHRGGRHHQVLQPLPPEPGRLLERGQADRDSELVG